MKQFKEYDYDIKMYEENLLILTLGKFVTFKYQISPPSQSSLYTNWKYSDLRNEQHFYRNECSKRSQAEIYFSEMTFYCQNSGMVNRQDC